MTMAAFNFQRFSHFLKWDLTYNKKFYLGAAKMILFTFLAIMMIMILFLKSNIPGRSQSEYVIDILSSAFIFAGIIYFIIMFGYTLKNLSSKQSRIFEMSIPATNLEKFTAHYLTTLIGVPCLVMISIAICDALYKIISPLVFHEETPRLIIALFIENILHREDLPALALAIHFTGLTYVFVNTFKYRHNIPITIAIQIIGLILLTLSTCNSHHSQEPTFYEHTDIIFYAFFALMNIGLWMATLYRFGRCQLTNSLNN